MGYNKWAYDAISFHLHIECANVFIFVGTVALFLSGVALFLHSTLYSNQEYHSHFRWTRYKRSKLRYIVQFVQISYTNTVPPKIFIQMKHIKILHKCKWWQPGREEEESHTHNMNEKSKHPKNKMKCTMMFDVCFCSILRITFTISLEFHMQFSWKLIDHIK